MSQITENTLPRNFEESLEKFPDLDRDAYDFQNVMYSSLVKFSNKKLRYPKSTARPSCFVGVLYDISREKICWWLINHFYVIGHESYRIRRNNAKMAITPFKVIQGHRFWYPSKAHMRLPISDYR